MEKKQVKNENESRLKIIEIFFLRLFFVLRFYFSKLYTYI